MAEMAEMGGTELIGGAKFENWLTLYCHLVIPCNTGLPFLSLTSMIQKILWDGWMNQ